MSSTPDLTQLELLAELDALRERLRRWAEAAPAWAPAETCRAMLRRLDDRTENLWLRWETPLVVATLGGTGTGKSALVNAILGAEVVPTGRQRPTTTRPTLLCRPDLTPEMLGIDPDEVEVLRRDLPILRDVVLIDCPDPDTTEEVGQVANDFVGQVANLSHQSRTNLDRLREILPHCDVLLITTTQQKYRSARVEEELAAAAAGAKLIFVQTHADEDDDVRADWQTVLAEQYTPGHLFFLDSLSALRDAREGRSPRGDFAGLLDLLRRGLSGAVGHRIRRANFLDLTAETLQRCRERLDAALPAVEQVQTAVADQRRQLAAQLAGRMRDELSTNRRAWENRLLAQTASRWGFSPFALVLRIYQGLGSLLTGLLLTRARTPAQMALWGAVQGARTWRRRRQDRTADRGARQAAAQFWQTSAIGQSAWILDGYAAEAGLDRSTVDTETLTAETEQAGADFLARAAGELDALIARVTARQTGWFARLLYEFLLLAVLGGLLYRLGKNFFWDSWLAPQPEPILGLEFYLTAGFWLLLWCAILIWSLTRRLRGGLRREIDALIAAWQQPDRASGLFRRLETTADQARRFRNELDVLETQVRRLRRQVSLPENIGEKYVV
ncbi:MAG: hypothetical protein JXB10_07910 [Pirellulales bacterium]|nr:hypothetical protein [Pirellulales bacterium]